MRRLLLALALLLAAAGAAVAADDQAFLGIFAETSLMKMPGMPDMSKMMAGMDEKQMENMPGMSAMMSMGKPQRKLTVRLWSPGLAPADAYAYIVPPKGLKQGDRLDLELYRPEPAKGTTSDGGDGESGGTQGEIPKFTIKIYWGSSEKVKAGQPKVITWETMSPEMKKKAEAEGKKADRMAAKGGDYFYKPDWTTGYWPTKKQPGKIANDASLVGHLALTTNYTGNVELDVPSNVDFLAPIELSSPDLGKKVPLQTFVPLKWKAIPNLLGSYASAVGMEGENTLVIWSSSEIETDGGMIDWEYMQMADVLKLVKSTVMMKGDRVDCTIPEAIFKDCDMVSFQMVGFGTGAALDKGQPLPRLQTRTALSITPLGGKKMESMGEFGGDETSIEENEAESGGDEGGEEAPAPKKKPSISLPNLGGLLK